MDAASTRLAALRLKREQTSLAHRIPGKTVLTDDGPLAIEVPRDRDGTFEPRLIPKHARRVTGFDDKIVALYARGMALRVKIRDEATVRSKAVYSRAFGPAEWHARHSWDLGSSRRRGQVLDEGLH